MKIAFDAKRALNNHTGLGNYSRNLLNALMKHHPQETYQLYAAKAEQALLDELQGNFTLHLPSGWMNESLKSLWRSWRITSQLQQGRVNVFHGLSNELPFNIHGSRIASVVTVHDLIFLKHQAQYSFIDRNIYETKTRYAAKHADAVIAVSEETKRDLMEHFNTPAEKIHVIYQSCHPRFYVRATEAQVQQVRLRFNLPQQFILHVGSFNSRKNQSTLLAAFAQVAQAVPHDLVLVGSGRTEAALRAQAQQLKCEARVHFVTNAANEDLPALYQLASAFVYPSLFEGFGIPILEALVSGTPVIATRGGCFEEVGGKHSIYIEATSAQEMGAAMLRVLRDASLRQSMVAQGLLHAQQMSAENFANNTMRLYKSLTR